MGELYTDKAADIIKNDLTKQFEKDDKTGYRDDQEICDAAIKVIDTYISEIQTAKNENSGPWALKEFFELQTALRNERNAMKGWKLMTDNAGDIQKISQRIDNAERLVLEKLALNRTTKEIHTAVEKTEKDKKYFSLQADNSLLLNASVNKPAIHEVLGELFTNSKQAYRIDYSKCTNTDIKNKINSLVGTSQCTIEFDATKQTYLLKDPAGKVLEQRALIWEGVRLIPMGVVRFNAQQTQRSMLQQQTEALKKQSVIDNTQTLEGLKKDPKWSKIIAQIPTDLVKELDRKATTNVQIYKDFLSKTETRLDEIILDAKRHDRQLQTDSVSKIYMSSGLMEIHLISGTATQNVIFWKDAKHLGNSDLYDLLDGQEDDYKTFLKARLNAKRADYAHENKQENLLRNLKPVEAKDALTPEKQAIIRESLILLEPFIDNLVQKTGSTRGSADMKLQNIQRILKNAIYSLEPGRTQNISMKYIQDMIQSPLIEKWKDYQGYTTRPKGKEGTVAADTISPSFEAIFSGDKNKAIVAIRKLGQDETIFGNKLTSYLASDIIGGVELSDATVQSCFKSIGEKLSFSDKDTEEQKTEKKTYIESLLKAEDARSLATLLASKGLIPTSWIKEEDVIEQCKTLKTKLDNLKEFENTETLASLANKQEKRKLALEAKEDLSAAETMEIQALQYAIDNPAFQNEQNQKALDAMKNMKYIGVADLVKTTLATSFVDLGGGAKGTNADIINDIVGVGAFNLSDSNAELVGEITAQVAEFIIVSAVTGGVGGPAYLATMRGLAAGARLLRATVVAEKILAFGVKGYELQKGLRGVKLLKTLTTARGAAYTSGALLLEAPIFNTASKALHSLVEYKNFDFHFADLNPVARENVKTAAFLGVMKFMSIAPSSQSFAKIEFSGLKTTLQALKMPANVITELGTMIAAEQPINLTFGREVIDPVTGEKHIERSLHLPSKEELAQMIGMILGMRAAAGRFPSWHSVEAKMASGDLKVLETKPNDIVVVDAAGKKSSIVEMAKAPNTQTEANKKLQVNKNKNVVTRMKKVGNLIGNVKPATEGNTVKSKNNNVNIIVEEPGTGIFNQQYGDLVPSVEGNLVKPENNKFNTIVEPSSNILEQKFGTMEISGDGVLVKKSGYFDGKVSKFGFTEHETYANSEAFDKLLMKTNELSYVDGNVQTLHTSVDYIKEARALIEPVLIEKGVMKVGEQLTKDQLQAIEKAHLNLLGGNLGELTYAQLKEKVSILNETFPDKPDVVRCLLEGGFCGKIKLSGAKLDKMIQKEALVTETIKQAEVEVTTVEKTVESLDTADLTTTDIAKKLTAIDSVKTKLKSLIENVNNISSKSVEKIDAIVAKIKKAITSLPEKLYDAEQNTLKNLKDAPVSTSLSLLAEAGHKLLQLATYAHIAHSVAHHSPDALLQISDFISSGKKLQDGGRTKKDHIEHHVTSGGDNALNGRDLHNIEHYTIEAVHTLAHKLHHPEMTLRNISKVNSFIETAKTGVDVQTTGIVLDAKLTKKLQQIFHNHLPHELMHGIQVGVDAKNNIQYTIKPDIIDNLQSDLKKKSKKEWDSIGRQNLKLGIHSFITK